MMLEQKLKTHAQKIKKTLKTKKKLFGLPKSMRVSFEEQQRMIARFRLGCCFIYIILSEFKLLLLLRYTRHTLDIQV